MSELAIVIVSFNARADLENCLASLSAHPPAISHEIVVVDNASSDGSAKAAASAGARVIALEKNAGFAAANNVGIRATTSALILLLNSDTVVPAGAIDTIVARLREVQEVSAVGPRLVDRDGQPELSFGPMLDPCREWSRKRTMTLIGRRDPATLAWLQNETTREAFVDWVTGACLLVWRKDAVAAGLLDERFFLYMEDVDFCHSLRRLVRKILFTPAATVTHLRGRSRAAQPEASRRLYRASHLAFYAKHHPLYRPLLWLYLRAKGEV